MKGRGSSATHISVCCAKLRPHAPRPHVLYLNRQSTLALLTTATVIQTTGLVLTTNHFHILDSHACSTRTPEWRLGAAQALSASLGWAQRDPFTGSEGRVAQQQANLRHGILSRKLKRAAAREMCIEKPYSNPATQRVHQSSPQLAPHCWLSSRTCRTLNPRSMDAQGACCLREAQGTIFRWRGVVAYITR